MYRRRACSRQISNSSFKKTNTTTFRVRRGNGRERQAGYHQCSNNALDLRQVHLQQRVRSLSNFQPSQDLLERKLDTHAHEHPDSLQPKLDIVHNI